MSDEEGEGGGLWCVLVGVPLQQYSSSRSRHQMYLVIELVRNVLSSGVGSLELMLNSAAFAGVVQDYPYTESVVAHLSHHATRGPLELDHTRVSTVGPCYSRSFGKKWRFDTHRIDAFTVVS